MVHPFPVVVGALAALLLGSGVSAAIVRSDDERAAPAATTTTTTTIGTTTTVAPTTTTAAPVTTLARVATTRVTSPPPPLPTTTLPPVTAAPTTTRPPLTRAEATKGLCTDIEAAVRLVYDGSTIAGGLRLTRAVNTYGDAADPAVVAPARRMLSGGLSGDLEASAVATREAEAACRQLGFPIVFPGGVQCVTAPCP